MLMERGCLRIESQATIMMHLYRWCMTLLVQTTPPAPVVPDPGQQSEVPQPAVGTGRILRLLDDDMTFENQGDLARIITTVFKAYSDLLEYRWSHMTTTQHERIFDLVLNHYQLPPQLSKEYFCKAFVSLAMSRISDTIYKARDKAAKKIGSENDYEGMKNVPPKWCVPERWHAYCDIFASEPFQRQSNAGKINRQKQQVRSTSGSKTHSQAAAKGGTAKFSEWYPLTHRKKGGQGWSTPMSGQLFDNYNDLVKEQFADTPEENIPPFVPKACKKVLKDRSVGPPRRKALGGLHCHFDEQTNASSESSSHNIYAAPASYSSQRPSSTQSGVSRDDFIQLQLAITNFGKTLSSLMDSLHSQGYPAPTPSQLGHPTPPQQPHPAPTPPQSEHPTPPRHGYTTHNPSQYGQSAPSTHHVYPSHSRSQYRRRHSHESSSEEMSDSSDEDVASPTTERLSIGGNSRRVMRRRDPSPPPKSAKGKDKRTHIRRSKK